MVQIMGLWHGACQGGWHQAVSTRQPMAGGNSGLLGGLAPGDYRQLVAGLSVGKRLPDAVYVHKSCIPLVPEPLRELVTRAAATAGVDEQKFDVVKLTLGRPRLSLLAYPNFFDEPFPSLETSWLVDLQTGQVEVRRYGGENPPILHRKETMLLPTHPLVADLTRLTEELEREGLFEDARVIGFRLTWAQRLKAKGFSVEDNVLVRRGASTASVVSSDGATPVMRHRTALSRYTLSTPMQALWRHNYLDGRFSVFDYGCGRGDDIRALRERGVPARGWDPHFAPEEEHVAADVVNLGFVLNVIENPAERRDALSKAYSLAKKVLAVAALLLGRETFTNSTLFGDGVLTARNTFQKYFAQSELREYIFATVGREPVAVAPGLFFVFRDDADEQEFLAARQRSSPPVAVPRWAPPAHQPKEARDRREARSPKLSQWEANRELLEGLWERCLELGRLPEEDELPQIQSLRHALGSLRRALKLVTSHKDVAELEAAKGRLTGDLLVYFALNLFERRKSFQHLPEVVRRDVRAFWGTYARAQDDAKNLLFSAGQTAALHKACISAASQGIGYLDGDHSLQLRTKDVLRLPALLRVYLGCAARLYGEMDNADLVKIHIQSGKVSLMSYDAFEAKALPVLVERVKINLRRQELQFFSGAERRQLLFLKSRFLLRDDPIYPQQAAFDAQLSESGLFDLSGFGPDAETFEATLSQHGLEVVEFELRKRRKSTKSEKNGAELERRGTRLDEA